MREALMLTRPEGSENLYVVTKYFDGVTVYDGKTVFPSSESKEKKTENPTYIKISKSMLKDAIQELKKLLVHDGEE